MSPADTPLDPPLDPRTHPYRDDIAADFLEGKVESKSFVPGRPCRLGPAQSAVMTKPVTANSIERVMQPSELRFGGGDSADSPRDDKDATAREWKPGPEPFCSPSLPGPGPRALLRLVIAVPVLLLFPKAL